jgi:hypothetical protein
MIAVLFILPCLWISPAHGAGNRWAVDFGGGVFIPFDGDHKDVYGTGSAFTIGVSPQLKTGMWILFDAGLIKSSGHESAVDRTFQLPEEEYTVIPVSLGIRTNGYQGPEEHGIRLYFGAAVQTVFTRWTDSNGESFDTPTVGLLFEMRPEVTVSGPWNLWLRNRFHFMGNSDYRGGSVADLNYSGSVLQLGVSYLVESGR